MQTKKWSSTACSQEFYFHDLPEPNYQLLQCWRTFMTVVNYNCEQAEKCQKSSKICFAEFQKKILTGVRRRLRRLFLLPPPTPCTEMTRIHFIADQKAFEFSYADAQGKIKMGKTLHGNLNYLLETLLC